MPTMSRNHKPLPEYDIDPAQIPALVTAASQLPEVTGTVARGFGAFLSAVHHGGPMPHRNSVTRYRKILVQLQAGPPAKGRRRSQAGSASLGTVTQLAATGGAGIAAVNHQPAVAAALVAGLCALVYITSIPPEGGADPIATGGVVALDARRARTARPAVRVESVLAAAA